MNAMELHANYQQWTDTVVAICNRADPTFITVLRTGTAYIRLLLVVKHIFHTLVQLNILTTRNAIE